MPRGILTPSRDDGRNLVRFLKAQANVPVEDIARQEHVSVAAVRKSIRIIERFRSQNSRSEVDLKVNEYMLRVLPAATQSIAGLLDATEMVEMNDPNTGKKKVVTVPDKTTRLEANRIVKDIIVGTQPKGPMVEVNNTNTNAVATLTSETMEERLSRLREKAREHNQLPQEVMGVPDTIDQEAGDLIEGEGDETEG